MYKGKSDDDKSNDSVIIFDGKEPNRAAKWFELSQAVERYAEYHCGTPGVEIWLGVSPVLTDENVTDAAQDALAFIRVYHGIREGDSSSKDDDFWQIPRVRHLKIRYMKNAPYARFFSSNQLVMPLGP